MSRAGFIVSFDGPAVKNGRMDVRDLAPALLSLGQIIDAANLALNGQARPINVEAKAESDILICEVRTVQYQGPDGLKTEHAVLRVIEHRAAQAQIQLPFSDL